MAETKDKKETKGQGSIAHGLRVVWVTTLILIALGLFGVFAISQGWLGKLPPISDLQNPINKYASRVYTDDGKLMGTWSYASENRVIVPYDSLPANLVNALVATEDARFFEHSGIDMRAFMRAVIKRGFMGQKAAGGGSTITQQLAKQLYSDVNVHTTVMDRLLQKPIEWYIAVQLERYYTKEEILTMYLNYFDFLHNAVGIKIASRTYFSKDPIDLTLEECATLVGMCKNPSYYNPIRFTERSRERRNLVLAQMQKAGYITSAEMEAAQARPLDVTRFHVANHQEGIAPYFRELLRRWMMADKPRRDDYASWQYQQFYDDSLAWETDPLFGWCNKHTKKDGSHYNIYTDGLKIYTTINSRMQEYAEEAEREHVAKYLQPAFDRMASRYATFPYIGVSRATADQRIERAIKQSERYRVMKADGHSEQEIMAAFNQKVPMTLLKYDTDGTCTEYETEMSPRDSILYYKKFLRTGMMAMDPVTGYVRAYVPGLDFKHFQYDNVLGGGRRQVGSTIKPYLYSLAMMNNWTPCSVINTSQFVSGGWAPRGGVGGMRTLASALAASSNQASARLIDYFGPKNFIHLLHEFGIKTQNMDATLPLCLGTCDISIGEMVSGYSAFANQGLRTEPLLVTRIEDGEGNIIDTFAPRTNEVLSREQAYQMVIMLRGVIDSGTGRSLRTTIKADMGGKTGTTNSHADAWFMGFTPKLVVGCWVGGEDRDIHFDTMGYGQGARAALPIYQKFMNRVYADKTLGIGQDPKFVAPPDFDPCSNELDDLQDAGYEGTSEPSGVIDESFQ